MKKRYALEVRGKQDTWTFHVMLDPAHIEEYRADGLNVLGEVFYRVPDWMPFWLARLWHGAQDVFNFRSPFGKAPAQPPQT